MKLLTQNIKKLSHEISGPALLNKAISTTAEITLNALKVNIQVSIF